VSREDYEFAADWRVTATEVVNHPQYARPVMMVREGWVQRGQEPVWNDTVTIRQIPEEVKP